MSEDTDISSKAPQSHSFMSVPFDMPNIDTVIMLLYNIVH